MLCALDGVLAGKSHRRIAIDIYGAAKVAAGWYEDGGLRSRVRRRIDKSLQLMNGGYRDLVAGGIGGHSPDDPRSSSGISRDGRPADDPRPSPDISGTAVTGRSGAGLSDPAGGVSGLLQWPPPHRRESVMSTIEPRYLDTKQAAAYLTISPGTLAHMRITGDGPPYAKSGRRVIYAVADLDAWVEKRKQHFTGETPGS